MGMSDVSFYACWLIHYGLVYFLVAIFTTLIAMATIWPNSNFFVIFITYYLFLLNCMF